MSSAKLAQVMPPAKASERVRLWVLSASGNDHGGVNT